MWSVLFISLKAVSRVVITCCFGAYLQRAGVLTGPVRKALSKMFVMLLLPFLLFTRILRTISVDQLSILAWLAAANLTYVALGCLIGGASVMLTQPPRGIRNILAVAPALGHGNAIPLMLGEHLCKLYSDKFAPEDAGRSQGYVGLYLIMHTMTLWGVGLNAIKGAPNGKPVQIVSSTDARPAAAIIGASSAPSNATSDSSAAPIGPEDVVLTSEAQSEAWAEAVSSMESGAPPPEHMSKRLLAGCINPASLSRFVPEWLNRPMVASLLAVALGLHPAVKGIFVEEDGVFHQPFAVMENIGSAMPVMALLSVGASFVTDGVPTLRVIGYGPLACLIVGRLVILPACGVALWITLRRTLAFFPDDPVFMLMVCLQCCTPSAFNIVTMCTLQGVGEREMAGALFFQNMAAVFTITAWSTVFLYFVV